MRNLSKGPQKSPNILKILTFTILFAVFTFALIRLVGIDKLVFKGPKAVVQLITDTGLNSNNGRVNVLLLGIGGQGHEGPNLSDTMILASIAEDGHDVVLVSIPRDLWDPSLSTKVNSVYAYGQEKDNDGLNVTKKTIGTLFGLPIHYTLRVDFNGFIKAVDLVDGIDVNVENAFVDSKYPVVGKEDDLCGLTIETEEIDGVPQQVVKDATGSAILLDKITEENDPFECRYETISFKQELTQMDGTLALKFVRSRHGTNGQGSDFARSARQQKVILAFRQKVLSKETLLNPKTILELAKTFGQSIDTDITDEEVPYFLKLGQKIDPSTIKRVVLDSDRDNSVLEVGDLATHNGQFVLVPKNNRWTDLAEYVQSEIFKLQDK